MINITAGVPFPLGAHCDGEGTNFAIFSKDATKVELCLFESAKNPSETWRLALPQKTGNVHHGYVPGIKPGWSYGFRVHGPYDPEEGLRFNPNKIVFDPYAKEVGRELIWDPTHYGYCRTETDPNDLSFSFADNAPSAALATVSDGSFNWNKDVRPNTPWHKSVIYETHVKGLTALHPGIPPEIRGTYRALSAKPTIKHLQSIGVTAVELLPVHFRGNESFLQKKDLTNYWGYNTLGFFAPDPRLSCKDSQISVVREFKEMVFELHREGIEVILDVVYNHTAEAGHLGPTLSFRGIDNRSYYLLDPENPRSYLDFTGCGNTVNAQNPQVLQLIMDSLRYWVTEMGVDGFRFDLTCALARNERGLDMNCPFLACIHQDPIISKVKLLAEPWDLGPDGYQVGNFPERWNEWNGKYRDTVRCFWKGDDGMVGRFATKFSGSSHLYQHNGRGPWASTNFITCHDGFSLRDLVSYNEKHNEQNQENNRDGNNNNMSWNSGVEGPTSDTQILELRAKQQRNFIATLLLSNGVPMIRAGDELGKTQNGNNNSYCQDNSISWLQWDEEEIDCDLLDFFKFVADLRATKSIFQRKDFFYGKSHSSSGKSDITWLTSSGSEMVDSDWHNHELKTLGVILDGEAQNGQAQGKVGDSYLLLFHAGHQKLEFVLPNGTWQRVFDTGIGQSKDSAKASSINCLGGGSFSGIYYLVPRSCVVFNKSK